MASYDEMIAKQTPEVARAIEDMADRAGTTDADWSVLQAGGEMVAELRAFKAYVHRRLDEAGVPTHPEGPHSAEGCRVGDRLDLVFHEVQRLRDEHSRRVQASHARNPAEVS